MDEKPYQLLGESREPFPMKPGNKRKQDSEYVRNGTCSIFMSCEPLAGWRHTSVREHRTALDWAEDIKELVDIYPNAEKIILVMDNLNTHCWASLYKRFGPQEAKRIKDSLEVHYTHKHGSWLDMAEIELNAMTRQCLKRRVDNIETLRLELSAWENVRNNANSKINWHFTTDNARTKLTSLYPKLSNFKYKSMRRYPSCEVLKCQEQNVINAFSYVCDLASKGAFS